MTKPDGEHKNERTNSNLHDENDKKADSPLTLTSPKQRQGSYFEQQACAFLQQQGLVLIAHNWQRPKVGELDLVMLETGSAWSTVVFIEVRQRLRSNFGDAALSITAAKQRKIIKTAKYFLLQYPEYSNHDCRFDVIAYNIDKNFDRCANEIIDNEHAMSDDRDSDSNLSLELGVVPKVKPIYQPQWLRGAFIAKAW